MNDPFRGDWLRDKLHLRIFKAEWLSIGPGWNTRDVQSAYWRFYRNDRDGAWLELADCAYALQGERLYFVPAGVRFHCHNGEAIRHFYVHFDVIGLPGPAMRELFGSPLCLPDSPALEATICALASELAAGRHDDLIVQCRLKSALYEGLARCLEAMPAEKREQSVRLAEAAGPVLPAIQFIENNLAASFSNELLGSLCSMSENFFIRRFRECVGQTPAHYVQERRITLAAQRLLFTDQSIEQIAETTGFGNRFYFSRVFTRHLGVAPAAYRKAARV